MPLDDTNWTQETKAKPNVFSLESLIAWLETQPAETMFNYCDSSRCLWARYLKAAGEKNYDLYSWQLPGGEGGWGQQVAKTGTYAAALSRARALLASRNSDAYLAETRK